MHREKPIKQSLHGLVWGELALNGKLFALMICLQLANDWF